MTVPDSTPAAAVDPLTTEVTAYEAVAGIEALRRPRRRPPILGLIAVTYIVVLILVAIFASVVAPHDPNAVNVFHQFQRPGTPSHLLGTDELGRDELSRIIYGARSSLLAAFFGAGVAILLGAPLGVLAGYGGGRLQTSLDFTFDGVMSIPGLIFALAVIAVIGPGVIHAMTAIGIVLSPIFYRLARAETLNVRREPFIEASNAIGCTTRRTICRHVVPNVATPIIVQATITSGQCIVIEAGISYLGFGVQPPTASWGSMLTAAQQNILSAPFLVYIPGIAIAITVLAFSVAGDWLRDAVSTRRRAGVA